MTTTDRRSKLASEISEHKKAIENFKLSALKAWDSEKWGELASLAESMHFLSQQIKAKLAEINRLTHIEDQEKVQELL
jgi:hypothetical protein